MDGPPDGAQEQPDGSWLVQTPGGLKEMWTQRGDGTWRKPASTVSPIWVAGAHGGGGGRGRGRGGGFGGRGGGFGGRSGGFRGRGANARRATDTKISAVLPDVYVLRPDMTDWATPAAPSPQGVDVNIFSELGTGSTLPPQPQPKREQQSMLVPEPEPEPQLLGPQPMPTPEPEFRRPNAWEKLPPPPLPLSNTRDTTQVGRTLSPGDEKRVEQAWTGSRDRAEMLTDRLPRTFFTVNEKLTRGDLLLLKGRHWLNDEVVNFYFQLLQARAAESAARTKGQNVLDVLNVAADRQAVALPHLLCFTSFFFARLMRQGVSKQNAEQMGTGYDFAGVRRWTRKLEMFPLHRRLHLFPVNHDNSHWCVACADIPPLSSIGTEPCKLHYFDSLSGSVEGRSYEGGGRASLAAVQVINSLRRYFDDLWRERNEKLRQKESTDASSSSCSDSPPEPQEQPELTWRQYPRIEGLPQQPDGSSCGVFMCIFAEALARGAKPTTLYRGRSFSSEDVLRLRKVMAADCLRAQIQ